jgi:hypothetical protein
MADPRGVAVHEAAHAVLARILAVPSGPASICDPNHGTINVYLDTAFHRGRSGRWGWKSRQSWVAAVIISMAGSVAEDEILGIGSSGNGIDCKRTFRFIAHAGMQDHEVRLRAMTRMLIRRHREAIEQVAQELLRETTLSGPELDELVEQYRTR